MNHGHNDLDELLYGENFCFVDRVVSLVAGQTIDTEKQYHLALPIIAAHFLNGPKIVPGVILVEQICQSALLLGVRSKLFRQGAIPILAEIKARFLHPVKAESTVIARVTIDTCLRDAVAFRGQSLVSGQVVCKMSGMVVCRLLPESVESQVDQ
jgi:3-hydroxymyristoyl/3-hydroxydecanoyl-(acyl carrier protein) dehydratase